MSDPIHLSEDQKVAFAKDGYIILPGAVTESLISAANDFIDAASLKTGTRKVLGEDIPTVRLERKAASDEAITDLLLKSGLMAAAEDLLGEGDAVLTGGIGHLDVVPTCEVFVERGMKATRPHPKKRWKVYAGMGDMAKKGAGFSVLVSVAMSEGGEVDEQRGQVVVWPGSHLVTQKAIAETVQNMDEGDDALKILHHEKERAECGDPVRVLVSPGDVVVAHQKLAIGAAPNLVETERRNVFFRIAHGKQDSIIEQQIAADLPWVGFAGLADHVEEGATEFSAE